MPTDNTQAVSDIRQLLGDMRRYIDAIDTKLGRRVVVKKDVAALALAVLLNARNVVNNRRGGPSQAKKRNGTRYRTVADLADPPRRAAA